jgi:hypothetical protein
LTATLLHAGKLPIFFYHPRMISFARIVLLLAFLLWGVSCSSEEEARHQAGFAPEEGSNIPAATPGPGLEKIQARPDSTPTPRPTNPMDRPLDPTGLPQG